MHAHTHTPWLMLTHLHAFLEVARGLFHLPLVHRHTLQHGVTFMALQLHSRLKKDAVLALRAYIYV